MIWDLFIYAKSILSFNNAYLFAIAACAGDNINHRKYDDNKRSYHHIRQLSDELCSEHNLSIIKPGPKRGMKYNEWAARKNGTSHHYQ